MAVKKSANDGNDPEKSTLKDMSNIQDSTICVRGVRTYARATGTYT